MPEPGKTGEAIRRGRARRAVGLARAGAQPEVNVPLPGAAAASQRKRFRSR